MTSIFSKTQLADYLRALPSYIESLSKRGQPGGICAEVTATLAKTSGGHFHEKPGAVLIPTELLFGQRALTTNVFSAGGSFAQSLTGAVDPLPRSASVCIRAGAQLFTGIYGNLSLPRQTGAETISFLHETDSAPASDSTTGELNLCPHRLGGSSSLTSQLDVQSGGAASAMIISSLRIGVEKALDRGALVGIGAAGDVLGLHHADGVQTKTFGGAATWAAVTDMQSTAATANAEDDSLCWIAHPEVRERWRNIERFIGGGKTLWHSDRNEVAGNRAFVTTASPTNGILVGDFSKLVFVLFGDAIEVLVNPFTQASAGRVSFHVNALADVGHLRPNMCVRNADSAVA